MSRSGGGYAGCQVCEGKSGWPAASTGANTCTGRPCRDEWTLRLQAARNKRKTLPDDDGGAPEKATDRFAMQSVTEVYGVGYCRRRDFSNYELRNGRVTFKHEVAYLVRGKIGEDADDDRGSDTRWVRLEDLVKNENIDDEELDTLLDDFFDELKADAKRFRRELREERDE